ncbi:hypothetical protein Tco_0849285 [Tanacetum coccineum]
MPPKRNAATAAITPMTNAQIKALIALGVADALAGIKANRTSRNGDDIHDSGIVSRRTERVARECTYSDFLKCQPLNFKGTEVIIGLTQWFERMESVFHISNCAVGNQVKYATCTLLWNALTWWNSDVKTVSHDASYRMPSWLCCAGECFPKSLIRLEKYASGLPDMIQGSMMDQKIRTLAELQAENKRKFEDTSRNNDDIK